MRSSHMSKTECTGLLAGTWDRDAAKLTVEIVCTTYL